MPLIVLVIALLAFLYPYALLPSVLEYPVLAMVLYFVAVIFLVLARAWLASTTELFHAPERMIR
ncbi:MAG: hypothetical protein EOP82_00850 [Variovorax sp.]|nr:MAG: hypothetical protein EOP82_00850 [Variovorax sp.]